MDGCCFSCDGFPDRPEPGKGLTRSVLGNNLKAYPQVFAIHWRYGYGLLSTGGGASGGNGFPPPLAAQPCRGRAGNAEGTEICYGEAAGGWTDARPLRPRCDCRVRFHGRQNTPAPGRYGCAAYAGGKRREFCLSHRDGGAYLRSRFPCRHAADGGEDAEGE